MQLQQIADILGVDIKSSGEVNINWLLTDSRSLSFPAESIFFAIVTDRNNGHKYVRELYDRQLRYFVVSELLPEMNGLKDAVFIQVKDTLEALQKLSAYKRKLFDIPVVGITGSNGKTIVKEWLYQLMHQEYQITRSPRSYNSQIGVPLSVWSISEHTELGVFEAGISQPGEMVALEKIIHPNLGIFTNVGDAHQENFVHLRQKATEKALLFKNAKSIVYCADHELVDEVLRTKYQPEVLVTWGKSSHCFVQLKSVQQSSFQSVISIIYKGREYHFNLAFTDDASIENVMHCLTFMLHLGYKPETVFAGIARLESVEMRLEVKEGVNQCLIINDSYNSDLNSMKIALDFLNQQATDKQLKKVLILSDILQSGQGKSALYKILSDIIHAGHIDHLIGIGEDICQFASDFSSLKTSFFIQTEDFLRSTEILDIHRSIVLLKGSRKFHFETISEKLELKTHETTLDVNLNALVDNLNYFRSKLQPETRVMCMVKAFAYGSGSVEVARTLQHHHCDYLAVAVADEGVELRREGIRIPIVVMNPEQGSFGTLFEYNLEPEIYSFRLLDAFIKSAGRSGLRHYPIHLKIDSGMHRLGFDPEEMPVLIERLKNQEQVMVKSVFSHLAGADNPQLDGFTHQQYTTFTACADTITAAFSHQIMRHLLNSAGTERFPQYQMDMVRLGIGHYGVSALKNVRLKQVCSLKTIILQVKTVRAGETVGYSRNGVVEEDKRIAILPLGYADGFNRKFGNGLGEVYIKGSRVKVIGNVSMDLTAIDLGDVDAREGDSVEIFGDHILISEIAEKIGTIPYEILTNVSRRVKRIYFQE